MKKEFHIWELYNTKKISIDVSNKLKDEIKSKISGRIYEVAKKIGIVEARLYDYFIYKRSPIPLDIMMKLANYLQFKKDYIEKNIILYKNKYVPMKNSIKNPKLPIKITPISTSVTSNLFFDGSLPRDGKGTFYNQKDKGIMGDFINKVKYVFGDVFYSLELDHKNVFKCRIPRIIGEICKHLYNVNSFGTFDSRMPKCIYNLSIGHKEAFILTAIIDEGSIGYDGLISFSIANKRMCSEIRNLSIQIGLEVGKLKNKKNTNLYYFCIKSIKKLSNIVDKFSVKYPLINLRYKDYRLKKALEIKKQKFYYTKDFADNRRRLILNEMRYKRCSINYLSDKYLIPIRTIRRYMYKLIDENRVTRVKVSNYYLYSLRI